MKTTMFAVCALLAVSAPLAAQKPKPTAAPRMAGPCFDNSNRYVNCNNGTVTDTVTGLIWMRQADCIVPGDYAAVNNAAQRIAHGQCGLTDNSTPGSWRLPTREEWAATVNTYPVCTPLITDSLGTGCYSPGFPFTGVYEDYYWSSSTDINSPGMVWILSLGFYASDPAQDGVRFIFWDMVGKNVMQLSAWAVR